VLPDAITNVKIRVKMLHVHHLVVIRAVQVVLIHVKTLVQKIVEVIVQAVVRNPDVPDHVL